MSTLKNMSLPLGGSHLQTDVPAVGANEAPQRTLYRSAALAAFVQLACVLMTLVVLIILGGEPETATDYFAMLQADRLAGILRMDFASLINVALFTITGFAIYTALKPTNATHSALGAAFIFIGVASAMSIHTGFSMLHLSEQYTAASEIQQAHLLAAGEAIIAADPWHSTGGMMAGIFLQGGMVLLSWLMLRTPHFSKVTAYTGLVANGLDWVHLLVGLVWPGVGVIMLSVGGIFYLVWYPALGRDFLRLNQNEAKAAQ